MKLLFLADGRSPIAQNWMRYFVEQEHEVHLASLYPGRPDLDLASLTFIPVAFSGAVEQGQTGKAGKASLLRKIATPNFRTWLRHQFVPRSLPQAAIVLQSLISNLQPDLIHAMRIPYEGMVAALACDHLSTPRPPLLVSVWGNDFTLHAPATRQLTTLTKLSMERADALHTDCHRDLKRGQKWGFSVEKPAVVLPGAGGIQSDIFYSQALARQPVIINPRGMRAYVRNDTFFKAIPKVLSDQPQSRFLCPNMQNQPEAEQWAARLGVGESLEMMPKLSRAQIADNFRQSQIVTSITTHDGTPNSLLEAMACGCFPIVGDIDSLREWITPGVNGFLIDPTDPKALASAILTALGDEQLRDRARKHNLELIARRAEYRNVMGKAEQFYEQLSQLGHPW